MKIILSPAKNMKEDRNATVQPQLPCFLDKTEEILKKLRSLSNDELKKLWGCSEKIAEENFQRIENLKLRENLFPAVLCYDGIVYKYIDGGSLSEKEANYLQENLRILSAFYGVLRPFDGITLYRLEMQSSLKVNGSKNLYDFWGDSLYKALNDKVIINLASKEYYKAIEKYLQPEDKFITCTFGEIIAGKIKVKSTFAKMARGEMVRFMAEHKIEDYEGIKNFDRLGFAYNEELSTPTEFVFIK